MRIYDGTAESQSCAFSFLFVFVFFLMRIQFKDSPHNFFILKFLFSCMTKQVHKVIFPMIATNVKDISSDCTGNRGAFALNDSGKRTLIMLLRVH